MDITAVACPDCFRNYGFRQTVIPFCHREEGSCPNCRNVSDLKINEAGLEQAALDFYVTGSRMTGTYASAFKISRNVGTVTKLDPTLAADASEVARLTGMSVFRYGPPLWRLGLTEHEREFAAGGTLRRGAADDLVSAAKTLLLPAGSQLFRVRVNPARDELIATPAAFDPPPPTIKREFGRWDEADHPVLYASNDVELCIHECRATISDEIVVACLTSECDLRFLDLAQPVADNPRTPFDDLNIFIGIMCRSRGKWLEYSREISKTALDNGYDGVSYVSYYAQAKQISGALNLGVFGYPIAGGKIKITSVNRIRIEDMRYRIRFGPVI